MIAEPLNSLSERPIERVMDNAFSRMRSLVEADMIIGSPVFLEDGASIIPVNRVTMGFLTGGGEYADDTRALHESYPFAGGSGAGVSVSPICFLVSDGLEVKLISVDEKNPLDKIFELLPSVAEKMMKGVRKR